MRCSTKATAKASRSRSASRRRRNGPCTRAGRGGARRRPARPALDDDDPSPPRRSPSTPWITSIDSSWHAVASLDRRRRGRAHARTSVTAAMTLVSRWRAPLLLLATAVISASCSASRSGVVLALALAVAPGTPAGPRRRRHHRRARSPCVRRHRLQLWPERPSPRQRSSSRPGGDRAAARRWPIKACAVLAAAALVTTVAASRLVLRAHDLSACSRPSAASPGSRSRWASSVGGERDADRPSA